METKHTIPVNERVDAFREFYSRRNRNRLLGFFLGSEYPIPRYRHAAGLPGDRPVEPDDLNVDSHAEDESTMFETHEMCGGQFIHAGSAYWGVPWLEAMIGCDIRASHTSGSLYAETIATNRELASAVSDGSWRVPAFDPDAPWSRVAASMLGRLALVAGGRFPLATTRMRGVADLLAAVFGPEQLIVAMIERPDYVRSLAAAAADLYIAFGRFQLKLIPEFHGGIGSFYYGMWAPWGTVWHQEDSCMLLSPELYREFIGPQDTRIFEAFAHNIIHFHSTGGYLPIDEVLATSPTAIELHRDTGGPSAEELYETHLRILDSTPLLIWGNLDAADLEWLYAKLPPEGLAIQVVVDTPEDAHLIWERYGPK